MKLAVRLGVLAIALGGLAGCYVSPGYSYVRGGGGGAYVGDLAPVYVAPASYYGPDYGDYGYDGADFGVSTLWIDDGHGHRYRRDRPPPRDYRDDGRRGNWHGADHDHDGNPGGRGHDRPGGSWGGRPPDGDQHAAPRPTNGQRPAPAGGDHPRAPGSHGGRSPPNRDSSQHGDHGDH